MRVCKKCGIKKPLNNYTSYKNYPNKYRFVCKECENEDARKKGEKLREELNKLKKEEEEVIKKFNKLPSSDQILKLLTEGYDVSWSGNNRIIFNKGELVVHAKNATREIYDLIFARYCIEIKK